VPIEPHRVSAQCLTELAHGEGFNTLGIDDVERRVKYVFSGQNFATLNTDRSPVDVLIGRLAKLPPGTCVIAAADSASSTATP